MAFSISLLGGAGFIGMNMYVYESTESALIIDCGVMFADYSYPGVDYIISDFSYLHTIRNKIKGLLLTHGHEDHIGGIPYLLNRFDIKIFGGILTLKLLKSKLKEFKLRPKLKEITPGSTFSLDDFEVTFNSINHSIPDTYTILLRTGGCSCLHASDFKIDTTPVSGAPFDRMEYEKIGNSGLDMVLLDSTNVFQRGRTTSESKLKTNIMDLFSNTNGRIFFTTFASNIDRIRQVLECCSETGRKVVFDGRSILKNVIIANESGYLPFPEDTVIKHSEAKDMADDKICFIVSGCQGENGSSLFKIVSKERKKLQIRKGDTFLISARVIPGNEKNLNAMINQISLHGGNVADMGEMEIHASGHASSGDLEEFLSIIKPKNIIPVHGEIMHQKRLCKLTSEKKLSDNCIFAMTGDKIVYNKGKIDTYDINASYQYIDTRGNFSFDSEQLKERKNMARDGVVLIKTVMTENKQADIETIGFRLTDYDFFRLRKFLNDNLMSLNDVIKDDKDELCNLAEKLAKTFFKKQMSRRPVIKAIITGG